MGLPTTFRARRRPRRVVSLGDTSIDRESSDMEAYAKDRDPQHLVLSEGVVWFSLQSLGHDELWAARSSCRRDDVSGILVELFRAGCVGIEGLKRTVIEDDGSETVEPVRFATEAVGGRRFRLVANDVMRHVPLAVAEEMGNIVLDMCDLGDLEKKASSPPTSPKTSPSEPASTAPTAKPDPT